MVWKTFEQHVVNDMAPLVAKGLDVSVTRLSSGSRAYSIDKNHIGMKLAGAVLDEVFTSSSGDDSNKHTTFRQGSSVSAVAYFKEVLVLPRQQLVLLRSRVAQEKSHRL